MITKNEEKTLERCLTCVKGLVDEIIIVDTGSTDKTLEIAKKFDAKIFHFEWNDDFSAARNFGLAKAAQDWILVLDADEIIASQDLPKIRQLVKVDKFMGYKLLRRDYGFGEAQNDSSYEESKGYKNWLNVRITRLFQNKGFGFKFPIHEEIDDSIREKGKIGVVDGIVIHHFRAEKANLIRNEKHKRYVRILSKAIERDKKNPELYAKLGAEYFGAQDFIAAFDCYLKASKLIEKSKAKKKEYSPILTQLGFIYLQQKDIDHAKEEFKKALHLDNKNAEANFFLAEIQFFKKNYSEAKENYETAIKHNFKGRELAKQRLNQISNITGEISYWT